MGHRAEREDDPVAAEGMYGLVPSRHDRVSVKDDSALDEGDGEGHTVRPSRRPTSEPG